jgi:hypothetical protein
MAQPILWQLVAGFDPLGQRGLAGGIQNRQHQENILAQLTGQEQDRQFRRETDARDFQYRNKRDDQQQGNWQQQFQAQRTDSDRSFGANRSDAAFNQMHQNRVFGLQERTANEAQLTTYEMPDGTKIPIRVDRAGNATPIIPNGMPQANPTNPYAPNGKLTDDQAKAGLYSTRMANSHLILDKFDNINQGLKGGLEGAVTNFAPVLSNPAQSKERQQFIQAQRDFINAVLRRESGAVISESEFANARQQYFPQPGDSQDVIAQKKQNRVLAIQGIMSAAGKTYQPPQEFQTRMNRAQFNTAVGNAAGPVPHAPQQTQQQYNEGDVAVNRQTGERLQLRNGNWVPIQ